MPIPLTWQGSLGISAAPSESSGAMWIWGCLWRDGRANRHLLAGVMQKALSPHMFLANLFCRARAKIRTESEGCLQASCCGCPHSCLGGKCILECAALPLPWLHCKRESILHPMSCTPHPISCKPHPSSCVLCLASQTCTLHPTSHVGPSGGRTGTTAC